MNYRKLRHFHDSLNPPPPPPEASVGPETSVDDDDEDFPPPPEPGLLLDLSQDLNEVKRSRPRQPEDSYNFEAERSKSRSTENVNLGDNGDVGPLNGFPTIPRSHSTRIPLANSSNIVAMRRSVSVPSNKFSALPDRKNKSSRGSTGSSDDSGFSPGSPNKSKTVMVPREDSEDCDKREQISTVI